MFYTVASPAFLPQRTRRACSSLRLIAFAGVEPQPAIRIFTDDGCVFTVEIKPPSRRTAEYNRDRNLPKTRAKKFCASFYAELCRSFFSCMISRMQEKVSRKIQTDEPANTFGVGDQSTQPDSIVSMSGKDLPVEFGRYRLLKQLGEGGMGAVYLAHDTTLGRKVAIKLPHITGNRSKDLSDRFRREARLAATLDHSNICRVFDIGEHQGRLYLTMAFVEGKSLHEIIKAKGAIEPRIAIALLKRIATAVQFAHDRGIIHRDLKPANIMIKKDRDFVLMDFGLARRLEQEEEQLTVAGTVLGTPAYIAPELLRGESERVGPQSDVYSLGIILFELLTGQRPFQGTHPQVYAQVLTSASITPSSIRSTIDSSLDAIYQRATHADVSQRFKSANEFATALGNYLVQPNQIPDTLVRADQVEDNLNCDEDAGPKMPSRESIKSFWVGISGLAVLAILASISVFTLGSLDSWLVSVLKIPEGQSFWIARYGIRIVIWATLIPSLVLGAVVPVLYWRGGLLQRFALSVVVAVTTLNLTTEVLVIQGSGDLKVPARQLIAILLCWTAMPMLFLLTPINTRPLRLIVACSLMLLSLCLSILHIALLNIDLLYWEALYGASFCYALLRRNWGRVAILEAGTGIVQIERTSGRTLLVLMSVFWLACTASLYMSISPFSSVLLQLALSIVLGLGCVFVSMACIRIVLSWKATKIWKLFVMGLTMWLLFGANSAVYFTLHPWWGWRESSPAMLAISVVSGIASLLYIGLICSIGVWLKWCGWRTQEQVLNWGGPTLHGDAKMVEFKNYRYGILQEWFEDER